MELNGALQLIGWKLLTEQRYEEAKTACGQALMMTERLLGPNSTDVAASLVNLATAQMQTKEFGLRTEVLYRRALEIYNLALTKDTDRNKLVDHRQSIGLIYSSLGNLYHLRGDDDAAEVCYREVLHLYNKGQFQGSEVAPPLKNLGRIYWKKGALGVAELMFSKALLIIDGEFGPDHVQHKLIQREINELRNDPGYSVLKSQGDREQI